MILLFRINLEIIQEAGKKYFWEKPFCCPYCLSNRLWGHGFVLRYFCGYVFGIWMKRWRCPDCRAVHTARPLEYSPGIQYPQKLQIKSLEAKLSGKPFLGELPRQTQQHWMKVFKWIADRHENWLDLKMVLKAKILTGQLWITKRRIYSETWPSAKTPYLPFALTIKRRLVNLE